MGKQICVSLDGVEVYEDKEAYEVEQLKKHIKWLEKELDKQRHKKTSCQIHIGELEQLCCDMYNDFGSHTLCQQSYGLAAIMDEFKQQGIHSYLFIIVIYMH